MVAIRTCEECGTDLPANAPQGLCPRCLVGMGLSLLSADALAQAGPSAIRNPPPAMGQVGGFGDYELLAEVARGGMGVVYRARQVSLNRTVAVKLLQWGQFASDGFVRRFRAEAEAVASLQHPNIVAIHEVGVHEGQHYFSMDFVEGQTLAERAQDNPLPAELAADYVKTIAEAVHYAHQHGVLHRDLKPSNVLIDALDHPRITDFGLAKRLPHFELETRNPEPTLSGQILGTPNYMPPEQASGNRGAVGTYSDVYSLGAIFYHLLTGRPPFQAGAIEETLLKLLNTEPVPPRAFNPGIPRDLETICLKCLHKEPARRYSSAHALAEDLGHWQAGEPIQARPASTPERFWRWCRRKPAIAALAASVVLLLVLVALGAILAAEHYRRLRDEAQLHQYASDMNVALRHWVEGNSAQAFALLQRHIPTNHERDLRGFEWRYLWTLCRGNYTHALPEHTQVVGALHASPNGQFFAAYAWNDTLQVWRWETGQRLFTASNVTGCGGFTTNSEFVVLSRADGSLQICRTETGAAHRVIPNAGDLVAFAAREAMAVTLTTNNVLNVWDVMSGTLCLSLPGVAHRRTDFGWGYPFAISPDGTTLAMIAFPDNPLRTHTAIRLWNLRTGHELPKLPETHQIRCLEFSPDGRTLAVGAGDGTVVMWNWATGEVRVSVPAHVAPVLCLAFSPDGESLASGSSDSRCIQLWEAATLRPRRRTFAGQVGPVWSLAFSSDSQRLASGTRDGPIRIWKVDQTESGTIVPARLHSHEYGNLIFSPDGASMAGGCADNTVKVWDVATLSVKAVVRNASFVVAYSPDGRQLLVSTQDGAARWWNLEGGAAQPLPRYAGELGDMISVALTSNGNSAALGLSGGRIQLLEVQSGRQVLPSLTGHVGAVRSLAFSPRNDRLVSGGSDRTVRIWETATGRELVPLTEHRGAVCAVAISPDGKMLASGCGAGTIKLWNLQTMAAHSLAVIPYHRSLIRTLAFSPDGRTVASGSEDRTVKLWNLASQQEVASFPHEDAVRLVTFSPDGNALATVTDGGTLRLFRVARWLEAEAAQTSR